MNVFITGNSGGLGLGLSEALLDLFCVAISPVESLDVLRKQKAVKKAGAVHQM